ncbi:hypothetical protein PsorP6_006070 [Peronosclerospora sorghi]|uniref:Uncharacterized protein n=1 Tax=Peronosclerospora sorghi TaxID=230839 RepID=A0ACC0W3M7_9STRA|nr:hypothetical protein PsorP6_006070 [Peronosclerospora sorghi]
MYACDLQLPQYYSAICQSPRLNTTIGSTCGPTPPSRSGQVPTHISVCVADVTIASAIYAKKIKLRPTKVTRPSNSHARNAWFIRTVATQSHAFRAVLLDHVQHQNASREFNMKCATMPTFHGQPHEGVDESMFKARLFMKGRTLTTLVWIIKHASSPRLAPICVRCRLLVPQSHREPIRSIN